MFSTQKIYQISPEVKAVYTQLMSCHPVQNTLSFLVADEKATISDQKNITEIPSPPFQEKARADYYLKRLTDLGLKNVTNDSEGNVFGLYKGSGTGPKLFVSAHLDTVFPAGTNTSVKKKEGRLYAPGIADDSRGLAVILSIIRSLNTTGINIVGDIIFGGTVGEEGLGNLRGVKNFFHNHQDIDGFISIDGTRLNMITYLATGSRRYEITYHGPGGHSFNAFGLPSATHALGRAIAKIANLDTPKQPKTTFTVGTITGGTSVNSIAAAASMLIDMRSDSNEELRKLEKNILACINEASSEENARWNSNEITVNLKLVGDRPAGQQCPNSKIVQAAYAATVALGKDPELSPASSTDANFPMSLGIPSLRLGGGGLAGQNHSLDEWFDPTNSYLGPQKILLTILALVGVVENTQPLLPFLKNHS
jgi:tripeptide aminopeptidase